MLNLRANRQIVNDEGKIITADNLLQYVFTEPVGKIEGWTLKDLLEFIRPHKEIFGEMAWCNLDLYYAELDKPKSPGFIQSRVDHIQVGWVCEVHDFSPNEISEYLDVVGINVEASSIPADVSAAAWDKYHEDPKNNPEPLSERYAIEFTPVNELADKPIKVDTTYEIVENLHEAPWRKTLFKSTKPMYLLDVIWAILWEISFCGSPAARDEQVAELNRRIEDIKAHPENLIPAEKVFEDLKRRLADLPDFNSGPQGAD